jgi:hypothetical protein
VTISDSNGSLLADPEHDERRFFEASEQVLAEGLRALYLLDLSHVVTENIAHFAQPPAS